MALPTYVAARASASGINAITPALPPGIATDDILIDDDDRTRMGKEPITFA